MGEDSLRIWEPEPPASDEQKHQSMTEEIKNGNANGEAPQEGETPVSSETTLSNPNMKWYIIHTYSGFERKVRESLESRVQAFGLQEKIGKVIIPTEPVTEIRNGKKYTIERAFLPGYVLVEMDLNDDVWHVVKSTPRVTGFLGTGQHPSPLSEEEVNQIVYRVNVGKDKPKLRVKFEKNESVRDRKSTRLNSSHRCISYAVFCLKKKKKTNKQ